MLLFRLCVWVTSFLLLLHRIDQLELLLKLSIVVILVSDRSVASCRLVIPLFVIFFLVLFILVLSVLTPIVVRLSILHVLNHLLLEK
jgi:hypothetical protein